MPLRSLSCAFVLSASLTAALPVFADAFISVGQTRGCDRKLVQRVASGASARANVCFLKQPYRSTTFLLPVQVAITSGQVTKTLALGDAKGTPLGSCVEQQVRRLRFPATISGCDAMVGVVLMPEGTLAPSNPPRVPPLPLRAWPADETARADEKAPAAQQVAEEPPPLPRGTLLIVDTEKLLRDHPATAKEKKRLLALKAQYQRDLDAKAARVKELEEAAKRVRAKGNVANTKAAESMARSAADELPASFASLQKSLADEDQRAVVRTRLALRADLAPFARRKQAALLVSRRAVLYAKPEYLCEASKDGIPTGEDCAPAKAPRVGLVDLTRVLTEHPSAQAARRQVDARLAPEQKKIEDLERTLQVLSPQAAAKRQAELSELEAALAKKRAQLDADTAELLLALLGPQLEKLASESKLGVILAAPATYTREGATDCTDVLLERKGARCTAHSVDLLYTVELAGLTRRLFPSEARASPDVVRARAARSVQAVKAAAQKVRALAVLDEFVSPYASDAHSLFDEIAAAVTGD